MFGLFKNKKKKPKIFLSTCIETKEIIMTAGYIEKDQLYIIGQNFYENKGLYVGDDDSKEETKRCIINAYEQFTQSLSLDENGLSYLAMSVSQSNHNTNAFIKSIYIDYFRQTNGLDVFTFDQFRYVTNRNDVAAGNFVLRDISDEELKKGVVIVYIGKHYTSVVYFLPDNVYINDDIIHLGYDDLYNEISRMNNFSKDAFHSIINECSSIVDRSKNLLDYFHELKNNNGSTIKYSSISFYKQVSLFFQKLFEECKISLDSIIKKNNLQLRSDAKYIITGYGVDEIEDLEKCAAMTFANKTILSKDLIKMRTLEPYLGDDHYNIDCSKIKINVKLDDSYVKDKSILKSERKIQRNRYSSSYGLLLMLIRDFQENEKYTGIFKDVYKILSYFKLNK